MLCYIWGTPAELTANLGGPVQIQSPRAGGIYSASGTATAMLPELSLGQKKILTTWLCIQRQMGVPVPLITSDNLSEIRTRRPLKFSEQVDRILRHFEATATTIGHQFVVPFGAKPNMPATYEMMAHSETSDERELITLLDMMCNMGYLEQISKVIGLNRYVFAAAGLMRVEALSATMVNSKQAFVAMWFNESIVHAYTGGIAPAIRDAGYEPMRIDGKEHINKIDDEIIAEIRRSRFLVADFTCEPGKARGGVYFEAGFAMALGLPVFWTCKDTSIADLHFDTRQYAHIAWTTQDDLRKQLADRISAVIGDGPLKKS